MKRLSALLASAVMVFSLAVYFPSIAIKTSEITDGLQVWYKFNKTEGQTAKDYSGNGKDATVMGDAQWLVMLANNTLNILQSALKSDCKLHSFKNNVLFTRNYTNVKI